MRHIALALLLLAAPAAHADECDDLGARIALASGAKKAGKRIGPSIEIRTAGGVKIDLTCRGPDPIVQAASGEAQPSATYFRELTNAGQFVVSDTPANIEAAVIRAFEKALRERTKSFIQQNGWSASCYTDPAGALKTLCSIGRIPQG